MKTEKDDRRSRRTRQLLANALIDLMLEKPYDAITVQDILDRADIGRSTFYTHYTDKDDLLASQLAGIMQPMQIDSAASGLLPSLVLFQHALEHRRLVQALVWGQSTERWMRDFQGHMHQLVEQNLRGMLGDSPPIPPSAAARFVVGTFLTLLQWWFEEEMRHTPEQMDAMFQQLVMSGIKGIKLDE